MGRKNYPCDNCLNLNKRTFWCKKKKRTIVTMPLECSDFLPIGKQKTMKEVITENGETG